MKPPAADRDTGCAVGTAFCRQCEDVATLLRRQALAIAGAVSLALAGLVAAFALSDSPYGVLAAALGVVMLLAGLAALGLSALLLFDAALFRWMAAFSDEPSACAAVDRFLAAARLKVTPAATRPLAARIGGARRLARLQGFASAVAALAWLLAIAAKLA